MKTNAWQHKIYPNAVFGGLQILQIVSGQIARKIQVRVRCLTCQQSSVVGYTKLTTSNKACSVCLFKARPAPRPSAVRSQWKGTPPSKRKGAKILTVECCRNRHCPDCAGLNRTVKFSNEVRHATA